MNFAKFFLSALLILSANLCAYSIEKDPEQKGGIKEEIKEYIAHHLKDSHSFGIASYTKENHNTFVKHDRGRVLRPCHHMLQ